MNSREQTNTNSSGVFTSPSLDALSLGVSDVGDDTPRTSVDLDRYVSTLSDPAPTLSHSRATVRSFARVVSWNPPSPTKTRKLKPMSSRRLLGLPRLGRTDSLAENKVLVTTGLRRSESIVQPDLFHYHEHFSFLSTIGETKASEVFKVAHRQSGEVFAVKRSRKRFRSKLQRERCLREIQMVASLPEMENIVAQYRAWQEGGHFYIQMDYCDGGSLQQHLDDAKRRRVDGRGSNATNSESIEPAVMWGVVRDVSAGLQFLHSNNVLHLDIKPENLYTKREVGQQGRVVWKIGDFGLAIGKEATDWEEGDGDYVAPELLRAATEQPHPAADIFSLGATLYQCATGRKLPRCVGSPNADISGVLEAGDVVDADVRVLLRAMTLPDPKMRPSASQVLAYADAVLRGDVTRPSLTAESGGTNGADDRRVDDAIDGIDQGIDTIDGFDALEEMHDIDTIDTIDTSRSCGPDRQEMPSLSPRHPVSDVAAINEPPKLPLLNLKQRSIGNANNGNGNGNGNATNGNGNNGQLSASDSFRIMRRDTARDNSEYADSDFGSLCDTERTMTTVADMQGPDDLRDLGDLGDIASPRRDGGLFGPLSSRLLRGHGSLAYDMASPGVNVSSDRDPEQDNCSSGGPQTSPFKKSQSRTQDLQHHTQQQQQQQQKQSQQGSRHPGQERGTSNRVGLTVWNEFDGGGDITAAPSRYRSPFADGPSANNNGDNNNNNGDNNSNAARDVIMENTNSVNVDKENGAGLAKTTAKAASRSGAKSTAKPVSKTSKASKATSGKNRPPHIPLLPIQQQTNGSFGVGKKRQAYRNSARSARSSHRSNSNDLSARSIDALMPAHKRVDIEGLQSELSARMKLI